MSARSAIISAANVRAFLSRPWSELAEKKRRHWRDALGKDPLATFHASEALWEILREQGHTTNAEERRADLDAHIRLRTLLDRAGRVLTR